MIDSDGFRYNVGIILANPKGQLFWGKRKERDAWQFPQGGMHQGETPEDTLYRELTEEIGLIASDITVLARSRHWLRYRLPKRLIRDTRPLCIGQRQLWFLLRLESEDTAIDLNYSKKPEFDDWTWASYFYPIREVIFFKREVYRKALREFAPYLYGDSVPIARSNPLLRPELNRIVDL